MTQARYSIDTTAVIHELLDGEVIVAHLGTGVYYSLREVAVPFWQLLVAGVSTDQVVADVAQHYGVAPAGVAADLQELLAQLQADELLVEKADKGELATLEVFWPTTYQAPLFERYEEMKDLLLLDPIHEVDEQGWPKQKDDSL